MTLNMTSVKLKDKGRLLNQIIIIRQTRSAFKCTTIEPKHCIFLEKSTTMNNTFLQSYCLLLSNSFQYLPRTRMRELGLCDRVWCPYIYIYIREYGSTLYVGLARAVSPTNTNFRLTFLLTRLQEALYEDLAV